MDRLHAAFDDADDAAELGVHAEDDFRSEPRDMRDENDSDDEEGRVGESTDAWLDTVDDRAGEATTESEAKALRTVQQRETFWASVEAGAGGPSDPVEVYLIRVIRLLLTRETPRAAMDRFLGRESGVPARPVFKSTIKAKRKTDEPKVATSGVKDMESFERITEATDALVAVGLHEVLAESRERLQERLNQLPFEYRWKEKNDDEVFGPFTYAALMAWNTQGHFKTNPIQVRHAKATSQHWRDFPPIV